MAVLIEEIIINVWKSTKVWDKSNRFGFSNIILNFPSIICAGNQDSCCTRPPYDFSTHRGDAFWNSLYNNGRFYVYVAHF